MKLAAEIVLGILIYVWGGWAVWFVNRRIDLANIDSRWVRGWIRIFVGLMVFIVSTAPLTYGLAPLF